MTLHSIPVEGGALAVDVHPGTTGPVLAIHGLTSNRKLWNWLRAEDPDLALITPDLHGRADSVAAGGPSSIARHVADLITVLDTLGLDSVVVCGMSMGGFVAVALATAHPERVSRLVLVDGGFPMAGHDGADADTVRRAFAPQAARGEQTFGSVADYVAATHAGMPLTDPDDPLLVDCQGHDLDADGRPRLAADVVLDDAVDTLLGPSRWQELTQPVRLLFAQWSVGPDSLPAYPADRVADFTAALPNLEHTELLAGADHAATVMTRAGAAAIAANLRASLTANDRLRTTRVTPDPLR